MTGVVEKLPEAGSIRTLFILYGVVENLIALLEVSGLQTLQGAAESTLKVDPRTNRTLGYFRVH